MAKEHTSPHNDSVADGMHNSLQRRDPRNPPMEVVKRSKVPPRKAHQEVIPHAKEPDDREACPRQDPRAVGDVTPYLL